MTNKTCQWLEHEIEKRRSFAGSTATASMVGIAADASVATVIGTIIIWITIDRIAYEVKASQ